MLGERWWDVRLKLAVILNDAMNEDAWDVSTGRLATRDVALGQCERPCLYVSSLLFVMPRPSNSKSMASPAPQAQDELTIVVFDAVQMLPPTRKASLLLDISLGLIQAGL